MKKPINKNRRGTRDHEAEMYFSTSVHPNVGRILEEISNVGLFGATYPEMLDRIICSWILEHADELRAFGIAIHDGRWL